MKNQNSIKNWAKDDRPREKLLNLGAKSLSIAELLAILIGSGTSNVSAVDLCRQIMKDNNNNLSDLSKKSVAELIKYKGIGEAKAISIVAAMELVKRKKFDANKEIKITSSRQIFETMYSLLVDAPHEEFWVIYLNRKNVIIHKENISKGGISSTVVDTRLIFKQAINHLASSIILVHNHPSGNTIPSNHDKMLTEKIKAASKLFDITLLDHLILGKEKYLSFADEGIL